MQTESIPVLQARLDALKQAAAREQSEQRVQAYRAKMRDAIAARDRCNAIAHRVKALRGEQQKQARVIERLQSELARLEQAAIPAGSIDLRDASEIASDEKECSTLRGQLERACARARELNIEHGNVFGEWFVAVEQFQKLDWQCGQLRPLSESERRAMTRTSSDDMGELNAAPRL